MNMNTPQYSTNTQNGMGVYDSHKKTDNIMCQDQEQKQQFNCAFCKRIALKPISLICNHNLCLTCANFLKEQESDSGIQPRFRVSCPACSANTVTYNVKNLLVQNGSEKLGTEASLKILSLQTSPTSKRNKKGRHIQNQMNMSSSKQIKPQNTLETCYNTQNNQMKTQNQNNTSWNSLESHHQRHHTLQNSNKLYGQQLDKSLFENNSQSVIRNNSLGTPFSSNKNGTITLTSNSSNTNIGVTNQVLPNNKNSAQSLFFTSQSNPNITNINGMLNQNQNNSSYVKCLTSMPTSQNYIQTTSGSHNNLPSSQTNCQNSSTYLSQQNLKTQQNVYHNGVGSCQQQIDQVKCHVHNEQYSLFCLSDKSLLCVECLYSSKIHKSHNIIPLKNAHQFLRKENEDFKIQSESYLIKLEASLQIVNQNKATIDREHAKSSQKINEIFDSMIASVNARRQKLLEQLDQSYEIHLREVDIQASELGSIKAILEEYKNFDEQIAENAYSESYIFSAFKMIQQTLEQTNLDPKPIKINFNIMQVENSHKLLFNKLVDKIVQLQSQKVEGLLHQTKCQKQIQQNLQTNNCQNSTTTTSKQCSNLNSAYAPSPYSRSKEPTPKRYSSSNHHNSLQNSQGKSIHQSIANSATSSQATTQRGTNKKVSSTSTSFSEKVQKRLNTQACSKISYKNIKRKLSTDFNSQNSSSKENIHAHPQYQQINSLIKNDVKKRSHSMQGEELFDPLQIKSLSNVQQSYDLAGYQNFAYQQQPLANNNSHAINSSYYGNIFLREKYTHQNYQTNAKETTDNSTNISQKRSPFKEYIIN